MEGSHAGAHRDHCRGGDAGGRGRRVDPGCSERSSRRWRSAAPDSAIPVDVEVVLAVDVSYSMDPDEQALQREGYMAAITSREFLQALAARHATAASP